MQAPLSAPETRLFCTTLPTLPRAFDSTMLSAIKRCSRYFYYLYIRQRAPAGFNIHLEFGGAYHKALEIYDHTLAAGGTRQEAAREAVRYAISRVDLDLSSDNRKTRTTLVRAVVWYTEHFANDTARTVILDNGKPAVELSFRFEFPGSSSPDGDPFLICGHLDKLVELGSSLYFLDRKAQPLTTKVLTPTGWTEIARLKKGDLVAGSSGKFITLKDVHPVGVVPTIKVTFKDGASVLCAATHLWTYGEPQTKMKTGPMPYNAGRGRKVFIPQQSAIDHPEAQLPLDPYILGCLLGNGYLNGNSIQLSDKKGDVAKKVEQKLPPGERITKCGWYNHTWTIAGGTVLAAIRELGLYGHLSKTKFIPEKYLFASIEQRKALMEGLLDTDGSWDRQYRRYQTMSRQLALDVMALVRSLGGNARITQRHDGCFRVQLRLPEMKIGVGRRYVENVTEVPPVECACLEVDAPDGLYVTEGYVLTHNTTGSSLSDHYFEQYSPSNQMDLYYVAGRVALAVPIVGGIIDAAQLLVGGARFKRGILSRTPAQLDEWVEETEFWINQTWANAEANYWPKNTTACGSYGGCPFQGICSRDPSVREQFLQSPSYASRLWNPLEIRGDV